MSTKHHLRIAFTEQCSPPDSPHSKHTIPPWPNIATVLCNYPIGPFFSSTKNCLISVYYHLKSLKLKRCSFGRSNGTVKVLQRPFESFDLIVITVHASNNTTMFSPVSGRKKGDRFQMVDKFRTALNSAKNSRSCLVQVADHNLLKKVTFRERSRFVLNRNCRNIEQQGNRTTRWATNFVEQLCWTTRWVTGQQGNNVFGNRSLWNLLNFVRLC